MNPQRGFIQLPMMAWGAIAAGAAMAALLTWGLYWRGEYREAKAVGVALEAQGQILAAGLTSCNAGADQAKRVGDAAIAATSELLEKGRKLAAPRQKTVERIETIIERPAKPGEGCDWAWDQIESDRQKARATP